MLRQWLTDRKRRKLLICKAGLEAEISALWKVKEVSPTTEAEVAEVKEKLWQLEAPATPNDDPQDG